MAFSRIHVVRRYDSGRNEFFYLYRFPFHQGAIDQLKERIQPPRSRFWYPRTKAWHVAETRHREAEEIIRGYTGLPMCRTCQAGSKCRAWSHLEQPHKRREPYRETAEDKRRAQERYHQQEKERSAEARRRAEAYASEAWKEQRRQEQERAKAHDDDHDAWDYWGSGGVDFDDIRGAQERQETPDDRWADYVGRRPDSKWAMRILGLDSLPELSDLRKSYRALALQYHPDLNHDLEGDGTKMALINMAKDYLEAYIS